MSIGRKIRVLIDGVENFIFEPEEDDDKTYSQARKKPAKKKETPKKQTSKSPDKTYNFGWLIINFKRKSTIDIKCRTGKLQNLATIMEELQEKHPGVKIIAQWKYNQQPTRGWVTLEVKIYGRKIDEKARG